MKQEVLLSYKTWDESDRCPYCGSANLEYEEEWDVDKMMVTEWIECIDCDRHSVKVETELDDETE